MPASRSRYASSTRRYRGWSNHVRDARWSWQNLIMTPSNPMWVTIMRAAVHLGADRGVVFSHADIVRVAREFDASHGADAYSGMFQTMVVEAPTAAAAPVGKVFRRLDRSLYSIVPSEVWAQIASKRGDLTARTMRDLAREEPFSGDESFDGQLAPPASLASVTPEQQATGGDVRRLAPDVREGRPAGDLVVDASGGSALSVLPAPADLLGGAFIIFRDGLVDFVEGSFREEGLGFEAKVYRRNDASDIYAVGEERADLSALIGAMLGSWQTVFSRSLPLSGRSLLFEIRDARNRWAHQQQLSMDDLWRVIDSMERLLGLVGSHGEASRLREIRTGLIQRHSEVPSRASHRRQDAGIRIHTRRLEGSKYHPIAAYLSGQRSNEVRLSFADLERILGGPLPASARIHRAWWSNGGRAQSSSWIEAGWVVGKVDMQAQTLTFFRRAAP